MLKNANLKRNPITTVLGILNTLLFGAVLLGLFDQATSDQIMLIVNNFAAVIGTSPTMVIIGTGLQAVGSIILLFVKDPDKPKISGTSGNVIRAVILLATVSLVSCEKDAIEPVNAYQPKSYEDSQELEKASERMALMQANLSAAEDELYAAKGGQVGYDSSINLKPHLSIYTMPPAGQRFVAFALSIDNGSDTIAQLQSMYYTIHFSGDLQPMCDLVNHRFVHNIWPPSAVDYAHGMLLENVSGQTALSSWYSMQPIYLPSSTGQLSYGGMPIVAWIGFTGTHGEIWIDSDPNASGFGYNGYDNYILGEYRLTL